jgi:hypothetical protein
MSPVSPPPIGGSNLGQYAPNGRKIFVLDGGITVKNRDGPVKSGKQERRRYFEEEKKAVPQRIDPDWPGYYPLEG